MHPPLRPFQARAVDAFFAGDGGRIRLLAGPPGTGKATTASAIVTEALRRQATGVAILSARNVVAQGIAWRAAGAELTPFELHRAIALSASPELSVKWPDRVLAFGSLRQLSQDPVADALLSKHWDLVVADLGGAKPEEAHNLSRFLAAGQIEQVLVLLDGPTSNDLLDWPSASYLPYQPPEALLVEGPIRFSVVEYERSPEEIALIRRAQNLMMQLRTLGGRAGLRLPAATVSSPLAAQSHAWGAADALRQLRNRLAHGLTAAADSKIGSGVTPDSLPKLERLRDDLMHFAEDVDALGPDHKWEAFLAAASRHADGRTVVFCDFAETAVYVTDRLQAAGMNVDGSERSADASQDAGNMFLVIRDDKLPGLDLRHVDVAFNYDLPASQRRAQTRWSRVAWAAADGAIEMLALMDSKNATPTERMTLAQFRHLTGSGSG